jgi:hypothetical protein
VWGPSFRLSWPARRGLVWTWVRPHIPPPGAQSQWMARTGRRTGPAAALGRVLVALLAGVASTRKRLAACFGDCRRSGHSAPPRRAPAAPPSWLSDREPHQPPGNAHGGFNESRRASVGCCRKREAGQLDRPYNASADTIILPCGLPHQGGRRESRS